MRKHTQKPIPAGMTPSEMATVGRFVSGLSGEIRPRQDPIAQAAATKKKTLRSALAELDDVAEDEFELEDID